MKEQAKKILKTVFGYDGFIFLQEDVIENILRKNDTLVMVPSLLLIVDDLSRLMRRRESSHELKPALEAEIWTGALPPTALRRAWPE